MDQWLPFAGLFLTLFGLVYQIGRLVQKFTSHEHLDNIRFGELKAICSEIRQDVRDLSSRKDT